MIKLRKTLEGSSSSMVIEPPHALNGSKSHSGKVPWRHMKYATHLFSCTLYDTCYYRQACGENLRRHGTRMDSVWALRSAYNEARKIKNAQDTYCSQAEAGLWDSLSDFPDDFKWEMLVDVLRGRVKVRNHRILMLPLLLPENLRRYPTIAMRL